MQARGRPRPAVALGLAATPGVPHVNRWFNPPPSAGRAVPIAARVDALHDGRAKALWALLGAWPLLLEALRTTVSFDGVPAGVAPPPLALDSLRALSPGVLTAAESSVQIELVMLRDAKRCFLSDFHHGSQAAL